jgi:hypothetical protein
VVTWDEWLPDVGMDVVSCPSPTIEWAVKRTVIDFLDRTHWLQRTAAPIDVAGGAALRTYPAGVVAATEYVAAVLAAWLDGNEIDVEGPADVEGKWPDWKTVTGTPESVVLEASDGFYVVPSPVTTMTAALRLKVAVGLLDTAVGCDDSIKTRWRDAITAGAKARLMFLSEKPWSDPQRAAVHAEAYGDAVKSAAVRALRTPARRQLQTKPYFF